MGAEQRDYSGGEAADDPTGLGGGAAGFALALQFLTSAPELIHRRASTRELGRSMAYFPIVGLLLGLTLAGADALLGLLLGTAPIRGALVVALSLLLSRGIHLDGLMDSADGLFGGWTPDRRLEIMRDSRVGSFGVMAGAVDLFLRVAAIASLAGPLRVATLVLVTMLGRWALVYATWRFSYARPTGMGAAYKRFADNGRLALASVLAIGACVLIGLVFAQLMPGIPAVPALVGAVLAFLLAWLTTELFGRYVLTLLPGQTGDTYGATNEIVEIILLIAAVALAGWLGVLAGGAPAGGAA